VEVHPGSGGTHRRPRRTYHQAPGRDRLRNQAWVPQRQGQELRRLPAVHLRLPRAAAGTGRRGGLEGAEDLSPKYPSPALL